MKAFPAVARVWVSRALLLLGIVALTLLVIRPFVFGPGFPYTHDGENHLARFVNFSAALREGQFPPRFAPYVFHGFGFPVFNYNYPLANIMAAPLLWINFSPGQAFTLIGATLMIVGGLSTFFLLRRSFSPVSSGVGTIWYLSSAYLASAWIFRGSIGEILAYALVPSVVLSLDQALRVHRYCWSIISVVLIVAFLLSHNVMALLIAPLLFLWSLSLAWKEQRLKRFLLIWLLGAGLTTWFWVPAVFELSLIVLRSDSLAQSAVSHILSLGQFFFSPPRFGFSRPSFVDSLGFGLGWGAAAVTFAVCGLSFYDLLTQRAKLTHEYRTKLLLFFSFIISFFLATELSTFLWESVPPLSIVQFPWRWQLLFALTLVVASASLWQRGKTWLRVIIIMAIFLNLHWVIGLKPADYVYYAQDHYLSFPHTTTTRNEDRPKTLITGDLGSWEPHPTVASGVAQLVSTEYWKGSDRSYTITVQEDAVIEEPTVYFPGWVTTDQRGERYTYDLSPTAKGVIRYRLLARDEPYHITTRFRERTPTRVVGESITLFSILGLSVWVMREERRQWKLRSKL